MSLSLEISDRAQSDLARQYGWYFKKAGESIAERYLAAFNATVSLLVQSPGLGRARRFQSSKLNDIRSFAVETPFEVHLIFYRVDNEKLSIERVIHGARDLPRRLTEPQ